MLNEQRKNQVVDLCRSLIRQPSYSGQEGGAAAVLRAFMESSGFDSITTDHFGNVIGCIKGIRPGKKLLFDGHIDTVPVSDPSQWYYPPFGAELHDDTLYGRGASDMKGAVAGFVTASAAFATSATFATSAWMIKSILLTAPLSRRG